MVSRPNEKPPPLKPRLVPELGTEKVKPFITQEPNLSRESQAFAGSLMASDIPTATRAAGTAATMIFLIMKESLRYSCVNIAGQ